MLIPKLLVLGRALPTLNVAAFGVGLGSAALIFLIRPLSAELARHADRRGFSLVSRLGFASAD